MIGSGLLETYRQVLPLESLVCHRSKFGEKSCLMDEHWSYEDCCLTGQGWRDHVTEVMRRNWSAYGVGPSGLREVASP